MRKSFPLILSVLFCSALSAQTFEVDQIEQLFRPRLRMDAKYIFDSKFKDTTGIFNQKDAGFIFTFPLKTKVSADLKLDLSSLKLKDVLKNSVRLKASQLLGMVRVNGRQSHFGFDVPPQKNMTNVTLGLLGVQLTKKYRVMFWSVNTSFAEEIKPFTTFGARGSALIGQMHMRGLRKNFFYGVAATYSDGLFLPAAFFGGSQPMGKKFIFNYILPVQLNVQYKDDKRTLITLGVSADGYRTGITNPLAKRVNLNYTSGYGYASVRYKFNRTFVGRLEGGYIFYQNISYTKSDLYKTNYPLSTGPYVQAGFSVLFGRTVWEKIAEGFLNN